MSEKITPLFGGPTGVPQVNATCVAKLEEWLEMARAGEIVGVGLCGLCHDGLSRFAVAGMVGSYGMVGAATVMARHIATVAEE